MVLHPAGDVAQQQGDMVVISTLLMLIIILPVIALTVLFAWRYRASNKAAKYDPHWEHSTQLELVIWAAPLLIIICLGALTWVGSHMLDPYRKLGRIDASTPVAANAKPLEVDVVALDWKWLFIYPEQGIATVNELVVPEGREIAFRITASNVMNSFYIPALAGQIYAMPGMETQLHGAFNRTGTFEGFSANYSGAGFPYMRFKTHSVSDADFQSWAKGVQGQSLDRTAYIDLAKPSEKVPVIHYGKVDADLYNAIVNRCVEPGKMCESEMMMIDQRGGLGKAGVHNVAMLNHERAGANDPATLAKAQQELAWVRALCKDKPGEVADNSVAAPASLRPLTGAGLSVPGQSLRSAAAERRSETAMAESAKTDAAAASRNPS
ncbi:ubiquinol oxidase subunit II [Novosphingobium sp. 9]|uniref:ubiquinol oxidase subunit II n=1 Tax=Novosphingobium sp. 9 TaxID=2025349 RepID=UPI00391F146E